MERLKSGCHITHLGAQEEVGNNRSAPGQDFPGPRSLGHGAANCKPTSEGTFIALAEDSEKYWNRTWIVGKTCVHLDNKFMAGGVGFPQSTYIRVHNIFVLWCPDRDEPRVACGFRANEIECIVFRGMIDNEVDRAATQTIQRRGNSAGKIVEVARLVCERGNNCPILFGDRHS